MGNPVPFFLKNDRNGIGGRPAEIGCGFNGWMQHAKVCESRRSVADKQRTQIYYTESQKALMWDRWQKGDSLNEIARLFNRNHSSIQGILAVSGGIRPPLECPCISDGRLAQNSRTEEVYEEAIQ